MVKDRAFSTHQQTTLMHQTIELGIRTRDPVVTFYPCSPNVLPGPRRAADTPGGLKSLACLHFPACWLTHGVGRVRAGLEQVNVINSGPNMDTWMETRECLSGWRQGNVFLDGDKGMSFWSECQSVQSGAVGELLFLLTMP
jgi:hypothetical protein